MAINQAYLFLIFTLNGIFIGLLFDFFRILRKTFKTINLITYIEDIIFWIITGISIIFCMYNFSDGSLRIFMFLGLGFGIILYMLTFSKIIIKSFVFIINCLKKVFNRFIIIPIKFILKIFNKFIFKPSHFVYIKIQNYITKIFEKTKYKVNKKMQKFSNIKSK